MKTKLSSIIIYFIILVLLGMSILTTKDLFTSIKHKQDYSQPKEFNHWEIKSIDTQIISRHWLNVPKESIRIQVAMLKALGVNYIAVATPYDRKDELTTWVNEIHGQGLHVWFRCHWSRWEGTDGKPANMTPQEYLDETYNFIKSNPQLFREGDSFTMAVEAEQVGVGLGRRFPSWDKYREFLLAEIDYSNRAFKEIGLERKIYTNWLSANGWVVENQFNKDLVEKLKLITIDHYAPQSQTLGVFDDPDKYSKTMNDDLERIYKKWKTPILIGEWGYQIHQDAPEELQADMIRRVMNIMKRKSYIVGMNYWAHMGNHSKILLDEQGSNLSYTLGAAVLKLMFE